jgi:hypothetical protein
MMQGHGHLHRQKSEKKKREPVKQSESGDIQSPEVDVETSAEQVMYLQRTIGNQATKRLLQAKRSSLIQRDGEGDAAAAPVSAPDPSSIPAPAPALDPTVAMERFSALVSVSGMALQGALDITDNTAEAEKPRPQIEAARDEIRTKTEKLRGQPSDETVEMGITQGEDALKMVEGDLTRLSHHVRMVEGAILAKAEGRPYPAFPGSAPSSAASPTPAPTPAPAPAPRPPQALVPDSARATRMEKLKSWWALRKAKKLPKKIETLVEQDQEKLADGATSHYARRKPPVPDPTGSKTNDVFTPLREIGEQVKSFAKGIADTVVNWLHNLLDPMLKLLDLIPGGPVPFVFLIMNANKVKGSYKRRKAFETAMKASDERVTGKPSPAPGDVEMQASSKYAYKKVNRGFWKNVVNFFGSLATTVLHLVTILTGGASALGTETAALVINVAKSINSLGHKIKGGVKYVLGMRGRNRQINATQVFNNAAGGDTVALKLLLDLKPYGNWKKLKAKLPGMTDKPKTESDMLRYLAAHGPGAEQDATINQIAKKMKSS